MGNLEGLKGVGTALITPFLSNGKVDEKTLASFVNWQIQEGIHFLVPCGTTGESPTLKHDEHLAVVDITARTAAGRVPVLAGAGGNDTAKIIGLIAELEKAWSGRNSFRLPLLQQADSRGHIPALPCAGRINRFAYYCLQRSRQNRDRTYCPIHCFGWRRSLTSPESRKPAATFLKSGRSARGRPHASECSPEMIR